VLVNPAGAGGGGAGGDGDDGAAPPPGGAWTVRRSSPPQWLRVDRQASAHNSIALTWDAPQGTQSQNILGYRVAFSGDTEQNWEQHAVGFGKSAWRLNSEHLAGRTFFFKVQALTAMGWSEYSDVIEYHHTL